MNRDLEAYIRRQLQQGRLFTAPFIPRPIPLPLTPNQSRSPPLLLEWHPSSAEAVTHPYPRKRARTPPRPEGDKRTKAFTRAGRRVVEVSARRGLHGKRERERAPPCSTQGEAAVASCLPSSVAHPKRDRDGPDCAAVEWIPKEPRGDAVAAVVNWAWCIRS